MKTQAVVGLNRNRVFRADTLHLRVENTVGARSAQGLKLGEAQMHAADAQVGARLARTAARPRGSPLVRGGKACPRTSGDLVESPDNGSGVYRNRVFRADTLYLRVENTVGARSAQFRSRHARALEKRY